MKKQRDSLIFLFSAAIASGVAGALVFIPNVKRTIFHCDVKAWELTTQFVFVAILGGAVGFAYRYWEMERADEKRRLELQIELLAFKRASLEDFYRSVVDFYNNCKKIRRTLRVTSIPDDETRLIERKTFEKLMDELEDAQLKAEGMKRSVIEARSDLFSPEVKDKLSCLFGNVEDYLRSLLRDYEELYAGRREKKESDLMTLSPAVIEFVQHRLGNNATPTSKHFFGPAEQIRDLILRLIEQTRLDDIRG